MAGESEFQQAVQEVQTFTQRPENEELLTLYGLFKQSTEGDNSGSRPIGFDFKAIAKFDAWEAQRGKTRDQAMTDYIGLVAELKKKYL